MYGSQMFFHVAAILIHMVLMNKKIVVKSGEYVMFLYTIGSQIVSVNKSSLNNKMYSM